MRKEGKGTVGRRGFFRIVGVGAAATAIAPLAREAAADSGTDAEKRKARYRESDQVKAFYRVNRYPTK